MTWILVDCLMDWNLDRKVSTLTVDNSMPKIQSIMIGSRASGRLLGIRSMTTIQSIMCQIICYCYYIKMLI